MLEKFGVREMFKYISSQDEDRKCCISYQEDKDEDRKCCISYQEDKEYLNIKWTIESSK